MKRAYRAQQEHKECSRSFTGAALLLRYCYGHEFHAVLLLHFRCALSAWQFRYINFEQGKNEHHDVAIMMFQIHFYYDLEASTALLQLLLRFMAL